MPIVFIFHLQLLYVYDTAGPVCSNACTALRRKSTSRVRILHQTKLRDRRQLHGKERVEAPSQQCVLNGLIATF